MSATVDRLTHLGVPAAFHEELMERRAPRFHTLLNLTIILGSLAIAVAALIAWSRYVDAAARNAAEAAQALLYDSDVGAESLGLILTALLGAGWLCGTITWRRGSESARNAWAADIVHEPAKHKAITNWLIRHIITRYTRSAVSADDFLDSLGRGVVRDLRFSASVMLALTIALGILIPARVSYATAAVTVDRSVLPFYRDAVRPFTSVTAVVSGCPNLPKDGNTLVYRLRFPAGDEANVGAWRAYSTNWLAALETIAAALPTSATHVRFTNAIGTPPVSPECLKEFGHKEGTDGIARVLRLLAVSDAEKKQLMTLL